MERISFDVLAFIFSYIDPVQLSRCERVCKTFKQVLYQCVWKQWYQKLRVEEFPTVLEDTQLYKLASVTIFKKNLDKYIDFEITSVKEMVAYINAVAPINLYLSENTTICSYISSASEVNGFVRVVFVGPSGETSHHPSYLGDSSGKMRPRLGRYASFYLRDDSKYRLDEFLSPPYRLQIIQSKYLKDFKKLPTVQAPNSKKRKINEVAEEISRRDKRFYMDNPHR